MSYSENPFSAGNTVVCVKDCPAVVHRSTDPALVGTVTERRPLKGAVLVVSETLGEYLRFEEFDTDSFEWWFHSYFRPLGLVAEDLVMDEAIEVLQRYS